MNPVAVILRAAQLARQAGLTVTFEPGWETRGNGYIARWVGVIVHHTAASSSPNRPFPSRTVLRDGRPGLSGPLCNSAGPADGSIHVMAAQAANHAGASGGRAMGPLPTTSLFNPLVFGHEIDYSGGVAMLAGQYRAAVVWSFAVLVALREAGQIGSADPERIRAHYETSVTGKIDISYSITPVRHYDMRQFRADAARSMSEGATVSALPADVEWDTASRIEAIFNQRTHQQAGQHAGDEVPFTRDFQAAIWRIFALIGMHETVGGSAAAGERNFLRDTLLGMAGLIAEIAKAVGVGGDASEFTERMAKAAEIGAERGSSTAVIQPVLARLDQMQAALNLDDAEQARQGAAAALAGLREALPAE